jgi:hypothetical protein
MCEERLHWKESKSLDLDFAFHYIIEVWPSEGFEVHFHLEALSEGYLVLPE